MSLRSNLWSCSELGAGMDAACMATVAVKQELQEITQPQTCASLDEINGAIMVSTMPYKSLTATIPLPISLLEIEVIVFCSEALEAEVCNLGNSDGSDVVALVLQKPFCYVSGFWLIFRHALLNVGNTILCLGNLFRVRWCWF